MHRHDRGGGRHILLIDLPPDLVQVLTDRRCIVPVLNNLFSNASRHSSKTLPIRVSVVRDELHVPISVSDEGRGIPPQQFPHLFGKYARVGGSERRDQGFGSGVSHLQGTSGSPRRPHPGRERRNGFGYQVYRLYSEEGLQLPARRLRQHVRTANPQQPRAKPRAPNVVWSMDFVSDQTANGQRFRALTVVYLFTRECLAIEPGKSLRSARALPRDCRRRAH